MPVTRTRISSDFIQPATCSANRTTTTTRNGTTTRTRISPDFIEPAPNRTSNCFGTTTHTRVFPSCYTPSVSPFYSRNVVHVPPPVYVNHDPAPVIVTHSSERTSGAGVFLGVVVVVALVAIIAFTPFCHDEKTCVDIGGGLQKCHFDRVCSSFL